PVRASILVVDAQRILVFEGSLAVLSLLEVAVALLKVACLLRFRGPRAPRSHCSKQEEDRHQAGGASDQLSLCGGKSLSHDHLPVAKVPGNSKAVAVPESRPISRGARAMIAASELLVVRRCLRMSCRRSSQICATTTARAAAFLGRAGGRRFHPGDGAGP